MTGQVLIADRSCDTRILLSSILRDAQYEVQGVSDAAAARLAMQTQAPSVAILGALGGVGEIERLIRFARATPALTHMPLIVLCDAPGADARITLLRAGADELMCRPLREATLLARMRSLLRACETEHTLVERHAALRELGFSETRTFFEPPARMAVVAPRPDRAQQLATALKAEGVYPVETLAPEAALAAQAGACDLYLIDATAGSGAPGLRLLAELRARPGARHAAVVIMHDDADTETAVMALDFGANDLLAKSVAPAELALRLSTQLSRKHQADRVRASVEEGLRLAAVDPLTGLYNRRYAMAHADELAKRSAESGRPYAVPIADLDRFKAVNDRFGHPAGDGVLTEVAQRLRGDLRASDTLARLGGEEFMVLMPDTSPAVALFTARRLCARIAADPCVLASGLKLPVTISVGVAVSSGIERPEALIARADGALYASKSSGRNMATMGVATAA
ncbi:MAG: diguanylate cyclase [Pseudomonadota bacterium]